MGNTGLGMRTLYAHTLCQNTGAENVAIALHNDCQAIFATASHSISGYKTPLWIVMPVEARRPSQP